MNLSSLTLIFKLSDGSLKTVEVPLEGVVMGAAVATTNPAPNWDETVKQYLTWGAAFGGKGGRAWAPRHAEQMGNWLGEWGKKFSDVGAVNTGAVEAYLAELRLSGLAPASVRRRYEALRGLVTFCLKRDILTRDPLKACTRPNADPQKTRRAMTSEECNKLLTAKTTPPYRALVYEVALDTALRLGELRQLTVGHLDLKRCGLNLPSHIDKARKDRFILLSPDLRDKLAFTTTGKRSEDALLQIPVNMIKCFNKDIKRAGIQKKLPEGSLDFHALRTTSITNLEEAGASDTEVKTFGRHKTSVASERYRRTREDNLRLLKSKARAKLTGSSNTSGSPSSSPAQDVRFSENDPTALLQMLAQLTLKFLSADETKRRTILDTIRELE